MTVSGTKFQWPPSSAKALRQGRDIPPTSSLWQVSMASSSAKALRPTLRGVPENRGSGKPLSRTTRKSVDSACHTN